MLDAQRALADTKRERVLEEALVVARLEAVEAHVRAARLAPRERRVRHRLGHLEHETKLDCGEPFGVERAAAVIELDAARIALAQLAQLAAGGAHAIGGAIDA